MEFVGGQGQQINALGLYIYREVTRRLYRICVKCNALFPTYCPNFRDGLNRTYLIVGIHDGYKTGVLPDSPLHLRSRYDTIRLNIQ